MKKRKRRPVKNKNFTTVSIPRVLFRKIQRKISGTGFTSVSSYVIYILREVIARPKPGKKGPPRYGEEDIRRVRERLRRLGYG